MSTLIISWKTTISNASDHKCALHFATVAQWEGRDGGCPCAWAGSFLRVTLWKASKAKSWFESRQETFLPQWVSSTLGPVKEGVCPSPPDIQFLLGFELLSAPIKEFPRLMSSFLKHSGHPLLEGPGQRRKQAVILFHVVSKSCSTQWRKHDKCSCESVLKKAHSGCWEAIKTP